MIRSPLFALRQRSKELRNELVYRTLIAARDYAPEVLNSCWNDDAFVA